MNYGKHSSEMPPGSYDVVRPGDPGRGGNEDFRKSVFAIGRSGAKAVRANGLDQKAKCRGYQARFGIEETIPLGLASAISCQAAENALRILV